MEKSFHHVADLPDATRIAVEGLVGHALGSDDVVYIATLGAQVESSPADREAAWNELESSIAKMQRAASNSGLSSEQLDALLDEECAAVRYGRP